MNKQLTKEQIESLHEFCEKHYVPYYDLQVELVDHLASAIESQWETEPELGFEKALNKTYSKFGVIGFSKVRMEREKELLKKYRRLMWRYVGQYYKLPKIILTIALSFLLFMVFRSTQKDASIILVYFAGIFLFHIAYYAYFFPKYYKIKPVSGKKFLVSNILKNMQAELYSLPLLLFNLSMFLRYHINHEFNFWIEIISSALMIGSLFMFFAFYIYTPGKIKKHFEEQFPQFVKD